MYRFGRLGLALGLCLCLVPAQGIAGSGSDDRGVILRDWYRMILELVRHTPTYTPPVASRSFAYTAIIAYESVTVGQQGWHSLGGQLAGLPPLPAPDTATPLDPDAVLNAAMELAVDTYFSNTGPTGQRAKAALAKAMDRRVSEGMDPALIDASRAYGQAIARHVIDASLSDGGAVVENMGFPMAYTLGGEPQDWVPTSLVNLQQFPLLPDWGNNRPLAMPDAGACALPPPPPYSEDPSSPFHAEAMEVYETSKSLTDEQKLIARFWSDDPMLSPTPPGHWVSIVLEIAARDGLPPEQLADLLARTGIAVSDGFIANWRDKYTHDLLRPVTYIRRLIDPVWEPLLITPPFPEYPSGHSTQSGAAASVLTAALGDPFPFTDSTHVADGLPARDFPDFATAAREAALSRLYGGIHFRAAIDRGLEQGACVGAFVNAIKTAE